MGGKYFHKRPSRRVSHGNHYHQHLLVVTHAITHDVHPTHPRHDRAAAAGTTAYQAQRLSFMLTLSPATYPILTAPRQ